MRLFGLITVALVAMAVIAITPVLSQNMNEPTVTKDESGMGEGIKVHGDWEVKVIDPETETENVYAFTNAFNTLQGSNVLVLALLGDTSNMKDKLGNDLAYNYDPDGWQIFAQFGSYSVNCTHGNLTPTLIAADDGNIYTNVAAQLLLSGTCEAPNGAGVGNATHLTRVATQWVQDDATFYFTQHALEQPVPVQAGQILAFNVNFSFGDCKQYKDLHDKEWCD